MMRDQPTITPEAEPIEKLSGHAIIAGFGVPGRAVSDWCKVGSVPYVVIEMNRQILNRLLPTGIPVICGNVSDIEVLKRAGIERSSLLAITVPDDEATLAAITIAKQLNPSIRVLARCAYISIGLEASRRGADEVVIAEQVVAEAFLTALHSNVTSSSRG